MVDGCKSNNIKMLMHKHGLTIEELAEELNVSISTINRLLIGTKIDPRLSTLRPIAKFFDVSIEELMGERPLSFKLKDVGLYDRQTLIQVPIIYWEQVKNAIEVVPHLNFDKWDSWVVVSRIMNEHSYALRIQQSSLPPPFYLHTIIVLDPGKEPKDSDYVLIIQDENPILAKVIVNGVKRFYQSLIMEQQLFEEKEIDYCGTVVQWTGFYCEK